MKSPLSVRVFAPATIGNVGSGFDVIGLALDSPGDVVVARRTREKGIHFRMQKTMQSASLPGDQTNVAARVAHLLYEEKTPGFGVTLTLYKRMPVGSGLGSSAASSVAAAVAVNALLPAPASREALLPFVLEGERLASGSIHADNAAPCLLGGAQLVRSYEPLEAISLNVSGKIFWVVVHPHLVLRTEEARSVLPHTLPLKSAVRQLGNVAGLVAGLARGDVRLVGACTEDLIAEPHRARLIPGFDEVRQAALAAGAYGCGISGAGPSLFAVAGSLQSARAIGARMRRTFLLVAGVHSDLFISRTNMQGTIVTRS